jgi:hypothetical protein
MNSGGGKKKKEKVEKDYLKSNITRKIAEIRELQGKIQITDASKDDMINEEMLNASEIHDALDTDLRFDRSKATPTIKKYIENREKQNPNYLSGNLARVTMVNILKAYDEQLEIILLNVNFIVKYTDQSDNDSVNTSTDSTYDPDDEDDEQYILYDHREYNHPKFVYHPPQLDDPNIERIKNETKKEPRPFKKLSEFISDDDKEIIIPESWIKVFKYSWISFETYYGDEIDEQKNKYKRQFKLKKDGRCKKIDKQEDFFQFQSESPEWGIVGFVLQNEEDEIKKNISSPQRVCDIEEFEVTIEEFEYKKQYKNQYSIHDESKEEYIEVDVDTLDIYENIGDEENEDLAIENLAHVEEKNSEAGDNNGQYDPNVTDTAEVVTDTAEVVTASKIETKFFVHNILQNLDINTPYSLQDLENHLNTVIDKSKNFENKNQKNQRENMKEIMRQLGKFNLEVTEEKNWQFYRKLAEILMKFIVKILQYNMHKKIGDLPVTRKNSANDLAMVRIYGKYTGDPTYLGDMEEIAEGMNQLHNTNVIAVDAKKKKEGLKKTNVTDDTKLAQERKPKKTNLNYLDSRTWIKFITEELGRYIFEFKNAFSLEEMEDMFHPSPTSPKSLYNIIYETESRMVSNERDDTTRQLGKHGTRRMFMDKLMDIEHCFKDDSEFHYEDAYYFANKLGDWCFEALNKYDIRIGTATFGIMAGKIKENSIWKTKSIIYEDEISSADTFGLFLSHLKRDFFEEEDKFQYKNHYGKDNIITVPDRNRSDTINKAVKDNILSIDKHYFNFNVESWLIMFERGLKEGVLYRRIEQYVEESIIISKFGGKKINKKIVSDVEKDVRREMKYIEYRIWKLLWSKFEGNFEVDTSDELKMEEEELQSYKTRQNPYLGNTTEIGKQNCNTFEKKMKNARKVILKRNTNFHLKKVREDFIKEMVHYKERKRSIIDKVINCVLEDIGLDISLNFEEEGQNTKFVYDKKYFTISNIKFERLWLQKDYYGKLKEEKTRLEILNNRENKKLDGIYNLEQELIEKNNRKGRTENALQQTEGEQKVKLELEIIHLNEGIKELEEKLRKINEDTTKNTTDLSKYENWVAQLKEELCKKLNKELKHDNPSDDSTQLLLQKINEMKDIYSILSIFVKYEKTFEEILNIDTEGDKCLQSIIMENDGNFTIKDTNVDSVIGLLDDFNQFKNEKMRDDIFPGIICGFLDIYSLEIYNYCKKSKIRLNSKRLVAKFVGRRLDTPEAVYEMYYNWNEKEEIMYDIMNILWDMDDPIESMANCIKYFDKKDRKIEKKDKSNDTNDDNSTAESGLSCLQKIWNIWIKKNDTTLSYSKLHTKLIPIIPKERLDRIRKKFVDTLNQGTLNQGTLVYTGDYKLCRVKKLSDIPFEIDLDEIKKEKYYPCKILTQSGDRNFNTKVPVNIHEKCFNPPDDENDKGDKVKDDEKELKYESKEFSKLHHVRLGSWNVACMNGSDIPTTVKEYNTKLKNITNVIFESHCNIVALQELPHDLKIQIEDNEDLEKLLKDPKGDELFGPRFKDLHNKIEHEDKNEIEHDRKEEDEYKTMKQELIGTEVKLQFKPNIMEKMCELLKDDTKCEWEIQYSPVNHLEDTFVPGERLDARKNRKEVYAFVYNTSVVRFQHAELSKTNKVQDHRNLSDRFSRCPIISNFHSNKLDFTLCTVHLPPPNKKIKTYDEIKDLGEKVLPGIVKSFGEKKAKSVIFLGDFNMGYMQKKKLLPRPTVGTWDAFHKHDYVPCIKATTNVLQNRHYDNVWMHHSMAQLTISKAGESNTGVIKVNEIEGTPFVIGSSIAEGFKRRVSDHNLVYVDLRNNESMPWSLSNVVIDRDK